ncbi:rod shape-determining protein MreC [Gluconobacter morbifer]|uniref:Cell shape-determining protein MreC n=1 Tax=Gluconobacter morbifer G707 TaxID=1088869 RepID=G6XG19_9PROT|nr:rod shape-determining protein MreC [Gluconobacter morbifer]EHH69127.1 rod shape-determining protein MreC [Gluconobacter morbifer G707]
MLSIHARQVLAKTILPVLILLAVGLVLLGLVRRPVVDGVRLVAADLLAPAYHALVWPQERVSAWLVDLRGATDLARENARLRDENRGLRHWYDVAVALASENARLKASLHWIPEAVPQFVTGRVTRDDGGPYSRAVLLNVGAGHQVEVGDVALDASGLLGRVTEVGSHTVRVLLINDDASRIPVTLAASHADAIMAGDDTGFPRLIYYPQDRHPIEGERVETRGQSAMPPGLPIGSVHYTAPNRPVVVPDADLDRLDIVRVFDYGEHGVDAPQAPGRVKVQKPSGASPLQDALPFSWFPTLPDGPGRQKG